jgi:hypothetical protein
VAHAQFVTLQPTRLPLQNVPETGITDAGYKGATKFVSIRVHS